MCTIRDLDSRDSLKIDTIRDSPKESNSYAKNVRARKFSNVLGGGGVGDALVPLGDVAPRRAASFLRNVQERTERSLSAAKTRGGGREGVSRNRRFQFLENDRLYTLHKKFRG